MKKNLYLAATLLLATLPFFAGCSKSSSNSTEQPDIESFEQMSDISKILYLFDRNDIFIAKDGAEFLSKTCGDVMPYTKGTNTEYYDSLSPEAATVISNFQNVTADENDTELSLKNRFYAILDEGGLDKDSDEYTQLKFAIDASFELFAYFAENQIETKASKFWRVVGAVAKCVGGTVGSAGLGALAGAGVGTVTLPVVGTVSGTAVGAISGALVGASTFC